MFKGIEKWSDYVQYMIQCVRSRQLEIELFHLCLTWTCCKHRWIYFSTPLKLYILQGVEIILICKHFVQYCHCRNNFTPATSWRICYRNKLYIQLQPADASDAIMKYLICVFQCVLPIPLLFQTHLVRNMVRSQTKMHPLAKVQSNSLPHLRCPDLPTTLETIPMEVNIPCMESLGIAFFRGLSLPAGPNKNQEVKFPEKYMN